MKNIREFFQRTDLVTDNLFHSIKLTLLGEDELIPENILGNKKTEQLMIKHNDGSNRVIKVDVNAFQSTKYYTKILELKNIDSSQLDLGFLFGFNQLTDLTFHTFHHIQKSLPTLPLLPKLTELYFKNVTGFNDSIITFPTLSTGGLKTFRFRYSGMHTDASVSRMLNWILFSSAKTLEYLSIDSVGITEIPSQIPSFTALKRLNLESNTITTIKNGELRFSVPVSFLYLPVNKINSIEPGAFQGIYFLFTFYSHITHLYTFTLFDSNTLLFVILYFTLTGDFCDADVYLGDILTRFEESVFRSMLEQMVSGTGSIKIYDSNLEQSS